MDIAGTLFKYFETLHSVIGLCFRTKKIVFYYFLERNFVNRFLFLRKSFEKKKLNAFDTLENFVKDKEREGSRDSAQNLIFVLICPIH